MCGIVGFVGLGDRLDLKKMTCALTHRGPDGEGMYVNDARRLHLGHRRLSIRDIAGGTQPMWNEDETVCVVYNGEIYNHHELRRELEFAGHVFKTSHSDTEVLVHGWEEWGADLVPRLNGMFAFCIADMRSNRLFLARDRFGEKPLYYAHGRSYFAFASELGSLALHPAVDTSYSARSLRKLFAWGYLPAPLTIYEGARKLPAGQTLTVRLDTLEVAQKTYWEFRLEPDDGMIARGEPALAEELRNLLSESVRRRLVSDVPLGIFLSGGIDSGAILATATMIAPPETIRAFTIGFTESSYDESRYARQLADHVACSYNERILDLDQARDLIPSVLTRLDEPLGDPSIVPTHMLSAFARESVTVALSGDGGDEMFAGYDPFDALGPASVYSRIVPAPMHRVIRVIADHLPKSDRNMSFDYKVKQALKGLSVPEAAWAPAWMAPLDLDDASELFHQPIRFEEVYDDAMDCWESGPARTRVDRLLQFFTRFYLQDDILTKVDRASMMCSLETRAVFLDNDLVDFCARLPGSFKYRNGSRKYLLKMALEPLLPDNILNRKKKGFGIPLASWMRDVPAIPPMSYIPGLDLAWAERAWREHRAGSKDRRLFLWLWWSLQSFAKLTQVASS